MPGRAVLEICKSGSNDAAVSTHLEEVQRLTGELYHADPLNPWRPTAESIREELEEHGAWDESELADDAANWSRLLWIAAWNIFEDEDRDCSDPVPVIHEPDANARLIAAAPDLLTAVRDSRDFLQTLAGEVQIPSGLYLQGKRAIDAADSALTKAKGGVAWCAHTSGPWVADRGQIRDGDGNSLASVPHTLGDNQDQANARLIAAAPELLNALRRLTHPMASDEDLTHALSVIAKAEGGEA